MELKAERDNAEVRIDKVSDYQSIVDTEWQIIYEKLQKIVDTGAQVVLSKVIHYFFILFSFFFLFLSFSFFFRFFWHLCCFFIFENK